MSDQVDCVDFVEVSDLNHPSIAQIPQMVCILDFQNNANLWLVESYWRIRGHIHRIIPDKC